MTKSDKNKSSFNIFIVGKDFVGLTAFCYKLRTGKFNPCLPFNIGIDWYKMVIEMKEGKKIDFRIYDTKGHERFRNMTRIHFKRADGIILMYSINSKESFDDLENWTRILKEENSFEIPIYLLGNKNDLERVITIEQGEKFAEKYGFIFSECSVKNDSWDKIKSIFEELAKVVYEVSLGNDKSKIIDQLNMKIKEKRYHTKLKILIKYLSL